MPKWTDLPRAVLLATSRISGDEYREVDGAALIEELHAMGHDPTPIAFRNVMFALRDDGGFIRWSRSGAGNGFDNFHHVKLGEAGRQEVEGWPTSAGVSPADVEALLAVAEERAEDSDAPEIERTKARAALESVRDLGTSVAGSVLSAWLQRQAGLE